MSCLIFVSQLSHFPTTWAPTPTIVLHLVITLTAAIIVTVERLGTAYLARLPLSRSPLYLFFTK